MLVPRHPEGTLQSVQDIEVSGPGDAVQGSTEVDLDDLIPQQWREQTQTVWSMRWMELGVVVDSDPVQRRGFCVGGKRVVVMKNVPRVVKGPVQKALQSLEEATATERCRQELLLLRMFLHTPPRGGLISREVGCPFPVVRTGLLG